MYKQFYSRFFSANESWLHFAAHSHHPWPDVSRDAHLQYWDDSAALVDRKWSYLYEEVIPRAQAHLARWLNTEEPEQIVFAPNTHEFVCRLISCFAAQDKIKILTTDSEFHSFNRQVRRLQEANLADIQFLSAEPLTNLGERIISAATSHSFDLIFFSSIFFNSGLGVARLVPLIEQLSQRTRTVVVDGYHSLGAVPTDLATIRHKAFFLGGGYKYLQSGEGVCFLHVPKSTDLVPVNTGWYAGFSNLESGDLSEIEFATDAQKFAGATFDPSGIYRLNAVMDLFERHNISQGVIHQHVVELQNYFIEKLDGLGHPVLNAQAMLASENCVRGHFLTFELESDQAAKDLTGFLLNQKVIIDARASRVRLGFGLYQDKQDIDQLISRLT